MPERTPTGETTPIVQIGRDFGLLVQMRQTEQETRMTVPCRVLPPPVPGDSAGEFSKAMSLDGVDQRLEVSPLFGESAYDGSFELSIKSSVNLGYWAGQVTSSSTVPRMILYENSANVLRFVDEGASTQSIGGTFIDDTWHKIGVGLGLAGTAYAQIDSTIATGSELNTDTGTYETFGFGGINRGGTIYAGSGAIQNCKAWTITRDSNRIADDDAMDDQSTFYGTWELVTADEGTITPSDLVLSSMVLSSPEITSDALDLPDDTLYVLALGQSNMLGRYTTGTKFTNTAVKIFNPQTSLEEEWDLERYLSAK